MIKYGWLKNFLREVSMGTAYEYLATDRNTGITVKETRVPISYCNSCCLCGKRNKEKVQLEEPYLYRRCTAYLADNGLVSCTWAHAHALVKYILKNEDVITKEK